MKGRAHVLDSTPLYDAVATQNTVIQVRAAIRKLLMALDQAASPHTWPPRARGCTTSATGSTTRVTLEAVKQSGGRVIDESPRPGSRGTVAFVHPKTSFGTLIELVQE